MNRREFLRGMSMAMAAAPGLGFLGEKPTAVIIEAEMFQKRGGWLLDQQFMDQMGSPFLLAHGLGKPVADAEATVEFPETGEYHVWVRTRDWVGTWKTPDTPKTKQAKGSPGIFKVKVDGKELAATFGEEGADWHWQEGGTVEIKNTKASVTLKDLTGFAGRCDAVLFSKKRIAPPNEGEDMARFRRTLRGMPEKPVDAGEYDLVVAGGGIAGMSAAVSGARNGLKVAFIQDRPVLGGNNSSEVRVWLNGNTSSAKCPGVGAITREFEPKKRAHGSLYNPPEIYEDEKREAMIRKEKNISLFLNHRQNGVEMDGKKIKAVIAQDIETGVRKRFSGKCFADCTGDGCVGASAGADSDMTVDGHMGCSNLWSIRDKGKPDPFPRCPWAYDLSDKPFPGRDASKPGHQLGKWFWESGCYRHPINDRERIRDNNFRAMYGAWDALKNVEKKYANYELVWAAYISGPRESRRLLGDVVLNKDHVMKGHVFDDGCIITGWSIDLHLPDKRYQKGFEGDEFITKAHYTRYKQPYHVPYRCLYSRNIDNLFMAGRDISVTHEALGTVRVMRTCGLMGEVVGIAAAICGKYNTSPRGVYKEHLDEFMKILCEGGKQEGNQEAVTDVKIGVGGQSRRCDNDDAKYDIKELPGELKGLSTASIQRGDYKKPAPGFKFSVDKDSEVYISVFDRGGYKPPKGWKKTDMKLTWADNLTDTVYVQSFKKGEVTVPGHNGKAGSNFGVPHMAFVKGGKAGK